MQDFFDVPSHIATDITTIDQHPTDACMSPRLPRAIIEGPDKTRGCRTDGARQMRSPSAATVGVTVAQGDECQKVKAVAAK